MEFEMLARMIALAGLTLGGLGILFRLKDIMGRPFKKDLSRPRGNVRRGILYAFTLGMAPWEKESTRLHWMAYARGILFHVGIFTAFAVLIAHLVGAPAQTTAATGIGQVLVVLALAATVAGSIAGFAGIGMRLYEPALRGLSLPDDYFSVGLTSVFVGMAALSLISLASWLPFFYIVTGLVGVYIPFSKIRHCVYFFYSKFFFGATFGRRGVIGQPKGQYR